MHKFLRLAVALLALLSLNAFARVEARATFDNIPVLTGSGQPATVEQIKAAAMAAGASRGWQITPIAADRLGASINVRGKHVVNTEIELVPGAYSIKYKSSVNMNDNGAGMIHPHYNKWVQILGDGIRVEAARQ